MSVENPGSDTEYTQEKLLFEDKSSNTCLIIKLDDMLPPLTGRDRYVSR